MKTLTKRKLAAIMFTDLVGYTAMMGSDEDNAGAIRRKHREAVESSLDKYNGSLLQYYGDGSLSIFNSAVEALACARDIQILMQQGSPAIPLRIGLHTGDIVHDEDGIYGNGVNLASRIESMGIAGAVLFSDKVYDEVRNHPAYESIPMGHYSLKNVDHQVQVYALGGDGVVVPKPAQLKGKREEKERSIAVLPFVNMSSDIENEYFSDGITEEILNALTRIDGLSVTSRTSAFAYKGKNVDIRQIGQELGVKTILEGSVRKAGNRVRVTAQLINVADGYHFWSENFDHDLEDIFAVQDDISNRIANLLRADFKQESIVTGKKVNVDAYELYLKGRFHLNKWTPSNLQQAEKYFDQAILLEPEYAAAYAGLSECCSFGGTLGIFPKEESLERAKKYAKRSLELDDSISEPHLALAIIYFWFEWEMDKAGIEFRKALEISPGNSQAHQFFGMYNIVIGNNTEALKSIKQAQKLDPFSATNHYCEGSVYLMKKDYEAALAKAELALKYDPEFDGALMLKAWSLTLMGRHQEALEFFSGNNSDALPPPRMKGIILGLVHAMSGKLNLAEKVFKHLISKKGKVPPGIADWGLAYLNIQLGKPEVALDYLEKGVISRSPKMLFAPWDPGFEAVRDHPRFKEILRKYYPWIKEKP